MTVWQALEESNSRVRFWRPPPYRWTKGLDMVAGAGVEPACSGLWGRRVTCTLPRDGWDGAGRTHGLGLNGPSLCHLSYAPVQVHIISRSYELCACLRCSIRYRRTHRTRATRLRVPPGYEGGRPRMTARHMSLIKCLERGCGPPHDATTRVPALLPAHVEYPVACPLSWRHALPRPQGCGPCFQRDYGHWLRHCATATGS